MKKFLFALLLTGAALATTITTTLADTNPPGGWCC